MARKRAPRIATLLLVTGLFTLPGCGDNTEAKAGDEKQDETPPIPVETAPVILGSVSAFHTGTATLEAEEEATVVAKVSGVVVELLVEEGARVKAGQVLARLDGERYALEVARAEANLRKLEQEYNRNKELHERNLVSAEAYQRLKFDLDALRASYELAKLQHEYTQIRAPIAGVVSQRLIKVGNMVTENQPVFVVTDFDPLLANLHVPERELGKLRVGQKATIDADALPGQSFSGVIDRISPVVDPKTGTFKVTVAVKDPSHRLKPGMFGRINIVYDVRHKALLVPRNAVLREDAEATVYVVENGMAYRRTVTTGYANNGHIEILSGLKEGERVVTVGQTTLKDGAKVAVVGTHSSQSL